MILGLIAAGNGRKEMLRLYPYLEEVMGGFKDLKGVNRLFLKRYLDHSHTHELPVLGSRVRHAQGHRREFPIAHPFKLLGRRG